MKIDVLTLFPKMPDANKILKTAKKIFNSNGFFYVEWNEAHSFFSLSVKYVDS